MVRYTGRAKTQTGMNTNQVGLKMSGCPSRVGRKGTIIRKFNQRVNCMEGLCGGAKLNGKMWRTTYRNKEPFCKKRSTKCAQAAGGVGRINAPYFNRKVRAGESGCTPAAVAAAAAGDVVVITGQNDVYNDGGPVWRQFASTGLPSSPSGVKVLHFEINGLDHESPLLIIFEGIAQVGGPVGEPVVEPAPPVNFPYQSVKVDFNGYTKQLSFADDFIIVPGTSGPIDVWIAKSKTPPDAISFWGGPLIKAPSAYPAGFTEPQVDGADTATLTFT